MDTSRPRPEWRGQSVAWRQIETSRLMFRFDIADKRVHACLYFIAPTGHGLKPLDVEVMKKIHKKVNIIPVIGKADSCTVKEVNMFKTKVR